MRSRFVLYTISCLFLAEAAIAQPFHREIEFSRPLGNYDRQQLSALGVEIHTKVEKLTHIAELPSSVVELAVANFPFVARLDPIAAQRKLSDKLNLVRRVVDPTSVNFNCAGLATDPQHIVSCPQAGDPVDLLVGFHRNVSFALATTDLASVGIFVTQTSFRFGNIIAASTTNGAVGPIAALDSVFSVTQLEIPEPFNEIAADTANVDAIRTPVGTLSGAGITLGIWEATSERNHTNNPGAEVLTTHGDFGNRVTQQQSSGDPSNHATHVAGTMVGDGSSHPSARGIAPAAELWAYDASWDFDEMDTASATVRASNHSYGISMGWGGQRCSSSNLHVWLGSFWIDAVRDHRFGKYRDRTNLFDKVVHETDLIVVQAAGNERNDSGPTGGGDCSATVHIDNEDGCSSSTCGTLHDPNDGDFDCLGTRAVAKNVITVGAVHDSTVEPPTASLTSFTSFGPADDGRIKPDIVANGQCLLSCGATNRGDGNGCSTSGATTLYHSSGTSMAAPVVTGTVALLLEHYELLSGGVAPTAATVKGLLLHTAIESGTTDGPDYCYGWGLLDGEAATDFTTDALTTQNSSDRAIVEDSYVAGVVVRTRHGLAGRGIRVTLIWTDPEHAKITGGSDNREPALVNDLDLRLVDSQGRAFFPWSLDPDNPTAAATRSGPNRVDNVEQVWIEPNRVVTGPYTIQVALSGNRTGPQQDYTLIVDGLDDQAVIPDPWGTFQNVVNRFRNLSPFSADGFGILAPGPNPFVHSGATPLQVDWNDSWGGGVQEEGAFLEHLALHVDLAPPLPGMASPAFPLALDANLLPMTTIDGVPVGPTTLMLDPGAPSSGSFDWDTGELTLSCRGDCASDLMLGSALITIMGTYNFASNQLTITSFDALFVDDVTEPLFVRGDANVDGNFNVADAIFTLASLFGQGAPSECVDATDANDDGTINIADPVFALSYLFANGTPLDDPFPQCGVDPTTDMIGCDEFAACP